MQKCSLFGSANLIHSFIRREEENVMKVQCWLCLSSKLSQLEICAVLCVCRSMIWLRLRLSGILECFIIWWTSNEYLHVLHTHYTCTHFSNAFNHVSIVFWLDKNAFNMRTPLNARNMWILDTVNGQHVKRSFSPWICVMRLSLTTRARLHSFNTIISNDLAILLRYFCVFN